MITSLLNFGCGTQVADEWWNVDGSPNLRLQRVPILGKFVSINATKFPNEVEYHDIVNGKLPPNHFTRVYSSHVLEHLSMGDMKKCLENVYLSMKVGGVFRSVMPDLEVYIQQYMLTKDADAFNRDTMFGSVQRSTLKTRISNIFGNSSHKWLYDFNSIEAKLKAAGFKNVRRAEFGDSEFLDFRAVEHKARWKNALGFECIK